MIIILLLILFSFSFAQDTLIRWEEEVNLSQDTVYNLTPWIECKDNYVHIVWEKLDEAVCYQRSTNGGNVWSSPIELNDTINGIIHPKLRLWGDVVHCTWVELWSLPYSYRVMYRHSVNNGETWDSVIHIGPSYQQSSFAVKEETLLVVVGIVDSVPPDPPGIYYYRSFNNGMTWTDPCFIRADLWSMGDPDMTVYGDSVFVVLRDGYSEAILYMVTTDWGNTWSDTTRISSIDAIANPPQICKNSFSHLFITWSDNKYSPGFLDDVLLRRSTDNAITWLPEQQITDHHLVFYHVDIASTDSDVYLVWPKDGSEEALQFRASTDMGETWWQIEDISNNLVFDGTIAADSPKIHIAWRDRRDYPSEIYYRQGTRLPVGIEETALRLMPDALHLEIYPNPFSKLITINFGKGLSAWGKEEETISSKPSTFSVKIYDISGKKVVVLGHQNVRESGYQGNQVVWNGRDKNELQVPAGVYFVQVKAGNDCIIKKVVKLK